MNNRDRSIAGHYNSMYDNAVNRIANGEYGMDTLLSHPEKDNRRGLTLLARFGSEEKTKVNAFLEDIAKSEPDQYYYPSSDFHITVMSIISAYEGFQLYDVNIHEYIAEVQACLSGIKSFDVELHGVTASSSCVLLQGFPDATLNMLRDRLRQHFRSLSLQQSIDKRYEITTAHSTVIRFCKPLQNSQLLLKKLEQYRNVDFGLLKVKCIELVYNDWYQRAENTTLLHTFNL